MKIYTKTGDDGTTALFGGDRVHKNDLRVEAYGSIDELNSFLGLLIYSIDIEFYSDYLSKIQHLLFNIGSVIATENPKYIDKLPQLQEADILSLEKEIDRMDSELEPMTQFILPGGGLAAINAHICRTVCRRAERNLVGFIEETEVHNSVQMALKFTNRLSDYFFVLSRKLSQLNQEKEVIWKKDISL